MFLNNRNMFDDFFEVVSYDNVLLFTKINVTRVVDYILTWICENLL